MKVSPRACRHCGSPAKGKPCWWNIKPRNWCGDPPCVLDQYSDDFWSRDQVMLGCVFGALGIVGAAVLAAVSWNLIH